MHTIARVLTKSLASVCFAFILLSFVASKTQAESFIYEVTVKKQEKKKLSRWSLAEWLETKNKMRLMDMWLALHTPSPFEFYLGGNMQFTQLDHDRSTTGGQGHFAAYASMFGLEAQLERNATKVMNGIFHWRIFGFHTQTTNITLQGGLRMRGERFEYRQPFAGVGVAFYFNKFFGLDGLFRYGFSSNANSQGIKISSMQRFEGGPFIDFKFLRIYGAYFHEQEFITNTSFGSSYPIKSGVLAGTRLYF